MKDAMIFLRALHRALTGTEINKERFIDALIVDGGVDIEGLPRQELEDFYDGCYTGDFKEMAWSFDEMSACYLFEPSPMPGDLVCRMLFVLLGLVEAIKYGEDDWKSKLDRILQIFTKVYMQLDSADALKVFSYVFDYESMRKCVEGSFPKDNPDRVYSKGVLNDFFYIYPTYVDCLSRVNI